MNKYKPETLAIRTINQYKSRDVISYLSLRYYLDNIAARSDNWIQKVCVNVAISNKNTSFYKSLHFKEIDPIGKIKYREIYLPIANEALAEAALLNECSKFFDFHTSNGCVFSYKLVNKDEKHGIFIRYIDGLRLRQKAIAEACELYPEGMVLYTDIKKFYPSISIANALEVWNRKTELIGMSDSFKQLGNRLIQGYENIPDNSKKTIPIGPAFCHFIGNLILQDLDTFFCENLPVKYFRYVDDITLVGNENDIQYSREEIKKKLQSIGLLLHEKNSVKNMTGPVSEWIKYKSDFAESYQAISWKTLIGDLKRLILIHPEVKYSLESLLLRETFRIPVFEYMASRLETNFVRSFFRSLSNYYIRLKSKSITANKVISQCRYLRDAYYREIIELIDSLGEENNFDRKSKIPKIKYRAGRLLYLGTDSMLEILSRKLQKTPDTLIYGVAMECISTRNIDKILPFGANCAQMIAQPLKAIGGHVSMTPRELSEAEEQALIVLKLYDVQIENAPALKSQMGKFASSGVDINLMKSEDLYLRDISCLHGMSEHARHRGILETYLDEDEELAFDAVNLLQEYISN